MNGELANDFGNLAQRVLSMTAKNCDGIVPTPGALEAEDTALLGQCYALLDAVRALIDRQQFHNALEAIWVVIRAANGYVDRQAPWKLKKEDPARMATVLYVLGETIRHLSILCQPVMPQAMEKMLDQLAVPADARSFASLGEAGAIAPGTALPKPEGVFPRFVDEE